MRMTKRHLIIAALAIAASTPSRADDAIELKVSHYLPPNHTVQVVLEAWGKEVETRSAGRLKLKIYPAA